MIDKWIKEIKKECPAEMLGMILLHNGIVRATAKDGGKVQAMNLSFDKSTLEAAVRKFKKKDGIADIKAWINEGHLGRFRKDVLPVFQELITMIKTEIISEEEL